LVSNLPSLKAAAIGKLVDIKKAYSVEILISANFTPTLGSQIAEPGTIE
jgi:hypothetical protein